MTRASGTTREDWLLEYYDSVVADPDVRALVSRHLESMAAEGEPGVTPSDVQAAQTYLRACIANMTITEASAKSLDDLAALWARGALGAARFRRQGVSAAGGRARPKRSRVPDE